MTSRTPNAGMSFDSAGSFPVEACRDNSSDTTLNRFLFDPPIELASLRPHGRLHLDRRIDSSAIRCGMLHLGVAEIHPIRT